MSIAGQIPLRESAVKVPSDMVSFGDAFIADFHGKLFVEYTAHAGINSGTFTPDFARFDAEARARHGGRFAVGFCDGHVEHAKLKYVFATTDDALKRWNNDNDPHRELFRP